MGGGGGEGRWGVEGGGSKGGKGEGQCTRGLSVALFIWVVKTFRSCLYL